MGIRFQNAFWLVCKWAAFLMTISAFTFAPLIWSHIDTHIKERATWTGQMCTGLMLAESHNGEEAVGRASNRNKTKGRFSKNRRALRRGYLQSGRLLSRVEPTNVFLLACGRKSGVNEHNLDMQTDLGGQTCAWWPIDCGLQYWLRVTTVLGKMASVKTEHDRLRDFVSLRNLGGFGGPSHSEGRRPSGSEVKENHSAVLVLVNLSKSRALCGSWVI